MNINEILPGKNPPQEVNVIIEIPAHTVPVKYEVDKTSGALWVDRFIGTSMCYPCNYGFVPNTLSEDGDPVDVLVVTPHPLAHQSVIRCRPIGMLEMTDESGKDAKILAVPVSKLTPLYDDIHAPEDLPDSLLTMIKHFFEHYKDLEKGKWVKIEQWCAADAAHEEINASIERFQHIEA